MRWRIGLVIFLGYAMLQLWRSGWKFSLLFEHLIGAFAFWLGLSGIVICGIAGIVVLSRKSSQQCSSATQRNSGEYSDTLGRGIAVFIGCCVLLILGVSNDGSSGSIARWLT
tara:strand:- start:122 stop:457 length:336 start_codon:yes stop_codon:yes gene_type:complete